MRRCGSEPIDEERLRSGGGGLFSASGGEGGQRRCAERRDDFHTSDGHVPRCMGHGDSASGGFLSAKD
jgi:hypothetical protein